MDDRFAKPKCNCCGEELINKEFKNYCSPECYKIVENKDFYDKQKASRFKIFQRDGFACAYCGMESLDGAKLHVDHIYPLSKGGDSDLINLITACERCNLEKSASILTPAEVKKFMMEAARRNRKFNSREYEELKNQITDLYKPREEKYKNKAKTNNND